MSDKIKIVMVDDETDLCLLVKSNLEETGEFEVVTISEPSAAEAVCRKEKPDLILLDNVMPKRMGSDVAKAIRSDADMKDTPIIMVSGKGEMVYNKKKHEFQWQPNNPMVKERGTLPDVKGAEELAKAYGANDYIAKPFTHQILVEVLNEVIAKAQKKKAAQEEAPPPIEP